MGARIHTVRASQPFSALNARASLSVDDRTGPSLARPGLASALGFFRVRRCFNAVGRLILILVGLLTGCPHRVRRWRDWVQ